MLRPQIEDYNTGSYEGVLGYAEDLDKYIDFLEDNCTFRNGKYKKLQK